MSRPGPDDAGAADDRALPEPAQVSAFRAFRRPYTEADQVPPIGAAEVLRPGLDRNSARRVYAGPEGSAFLVPGPGVLCFISFKGGGEESTAGDTTTELAAQDGMGIVSSGTGEPVTFAGVLPAEAHNLRIIDRSGRTINVAVSDDDGYWITVPDPVDMLWSRPDGTTHQTPFGRFDIKRLFG